MERDVLTAKKVLNMTRPGVYTDGPGRYGLTLTVKTGSYGTRKVWTQRLTVAGRRTMIGLGKVEFVTLAEARTMAFENARGVARGEGLVHGGTRRRSASPRRTVPTFAQAADEYIVLQAPGWKAGSRSGSHWRSSLLHAQAIADRPVDAIDTDDVIEVLGALVKAGKVPTGKALRQRIRAIFDFARSKGWRLDNPADKRIDAALPKNAHKPVSRAAVPVADVSNVIARTRAIKNRSWAGLKGAFELTILTAARTAEVLGMTFAEVNFHDRTWTIPAPRMKASKMHRVPLSDAAIRVLQDARERHGATGLVFRSPTGLRIDEAALRHVMKTIQCKATVHGFRGTFKSWAMEAGIARDVAEFSLAHSFMGDVEGSYVHTDLLEQRRPVMQAWADHVTANL